jgi:hypothetical protein
MYGLWRREDLILFRPEECLRKKGKNELKIKLG